MHCNCNRTMTSYSEIDLAGKYGSSGCIKINYIHGLVAVRSETASKAYPNNDRLTV